MFKRWLALVALASVGLMLCSLAIVGQTRADEPDYNLPGGFSLPWAQDQAFRVTWEPDDHWAHGKARGVAFDFSMDIGTPLYAPTDGWIYYLRDERPFSTNYGYYVEIVSEDGDWLIRLAHLRDEQSGEGPIRVGDLIGHSGMSGATAAHLHLELLVREGDAWVCPDLNRLDRFLGYPTEALIEDAMIANREQTPRVELGDLAFSGNRALGEPVTVTLALSNTGAAPLDLREAQVTFAHERGDAVSGELIGQWRLAPQGGAELEVPVRFDRGGAWRIAAVTYRGDATAGRLSASGEIDMPSAPVAVVGLRALSLSCDTRAQLKVEAVLANISAKPVACDAIEIIGVRPDGSPWRIVSPERVEIGSGAQVTLTLTSPWMATQAGSWEMSDVAINLNGQRVYLDAAPLSFAVSGPELRVDAIQVFEGDLSLYMMVTLRNAGTEPIKPDLVEVWGWQPGDIESFGASQAIRMPIQPGASARYLLSAPTDGHAGTWQVAGAGTWQQGVYTPLLLPSEPAIDVAPLALISLLK